MNLKELNEKFVRGREGLTDEELFELLNLYKLLIARSSSLDSDFSLFRKELNRRYEILEQFELQRKIK
jgi:hypothetical protein